MATFFLIVIYMAFISLGLPDSLLGSAWPVMQLDLGADLSMAGVVSMVVSGGTIVSSLMGARVVNKFGTGRVTFISVMLTAGALLGISFVPSVLWLLVLAVPLGLGAGAVDAGLNDFVAQHYKARHMSWLHCFWGVGATAGPIIMAQFISGGSSWRGGYRTIGFIQLALVILLFFTLPLWGKIKSKSNGEEGQASDLLGQDIPYEAKVWRIKGVKASLTTFLFYCGAELSVGLWGSSYLVNVKNLSAVDAARWVSMYYLGITVGRFIGGFVTMKLSSKVLIRIGQGFVLFGALILLLPLPAVVSLAGFILIGIGCAPIFPSMLHETPNRFGKANSQRIMGLQMAVAYTGNTLLPPLLGLIATRMSMVVFPVFVVIYAVGMLLFSERINLLMKARLQKK